MFFSLSLSKFSQSLPPFLPGSAVSACISCYCSQRAGDNKTQPAATSGIFRSLHNNTTATPAHRLRHKPGADEGKPTAASKLSSDFSFLKRRNWVFFFYIFVRKTRATRDTESPVFSKIQAVELLAVSRC